MVLYVILLATRRINQDFIKHPTAEHLVDTWSLNIMMQNNTVYRTVNDTKLYVTDAGFFLMFPSNKIPQHTIYSKSKAGDYHIFTFMTGINNHVSDSTTTTRGFSASSM